MLFINLIDFPRFCQKKILNLFYVSKIIVLFDLSFMLLPVEIYFILKKTKWQKRRI